MAILNVKTETYDRLAVKAAARNTTVDDLVEPVLDQLAGVEPSSDERELAFKEWMVLVLKRANRYPVGFQLDDGCTTLYANRGE